MEHLSHFGLSRDPFANDSTLSGYLENPAFTDVARRLERGASQGKGLCVLTGCGGSGKTLLVRRLLESLEEEVYEAVMLVPMPGISDARWILDRFARQLGVEAPEEDPSELLGQVYEQLAIVREDGRRAVLIIDEAHVLADREVLGELRGLLNLEYEDHRLLTMFLVGLPHLASAVEEDPALADRVEIRVEMPKLEREFALRYLSDRIRSVGGNPAILESAALEAIVTLADGNPRRLNTLADNSLYEAFLAGRASATAQDVERAASALGLSTEGDSAQPEGASLFEQMAAAGESDAEEEASEVIAADSHPPLSRRNPAETIALLPDQGPPKDDEIDDLFVDLVDDD